MSTRRANTLISIIVLLAMLIQPLAADVTAAPPAEPAAPPHPVDPQRPGVLFRATVTLTGSRSLARLAALGVVVLESDEGRTTNDESFSSSVIRPSSALVLADADQLTDLARFGFQPQAADELGLLVAAQGAEKAWLAAGLRPLLAQADAIGAQQAMAGVAGAAAAPDAAAIQALRSAMHALSPEQLAGVAGSASVDDDADGLTNTEEAWWCTDPVDADTKENGVSDGQAVANLLSWMNNEISGPPSSGTPFAGWPMVPGDGQFNPNCIDQDQDSVPDQAERWVLGLNPNWESTSGDKFDDGQKLFGLTKYPGYGALPRAEDTFITANMPGWVTAPGTHPLVAAYPQIEIAIVPNSTMVTLVSEITVGETHGEGYTVGYATTHSEGTSMGVGKSQSHTHSQWQEIGNSVADSVERSIYQSKMQSYSQQYTWEHSVGTHDESETGGQASVTIGEHASIGATVSAEVSTEVSAEVGLNASVGASVGASMGVAATTELGTSLEGTQGQSWSSRSGTTNQNSYGGSSGYEVAYESGQSYTVSQIQERSQAHGQGYESTEETTITREDYEEFAVTNENQLATTQEWSTATAINTRHVADLQFGYYINNNGTDSARQIENILFNIYIAGERNPISTLATVSVGDSCTPTVINSLRTYARRLT